MPRHEKRFAGEHPCGRKAAITQHTNGYCSWAIFEADGKPFRSDTATSLRTSKQEIREWTFVGMSYIYVVMGGKWRWNEVYE